MCAGNCTHFFWRHKDLYNNKKADSLSSANQIIHTQRAKIRTLENTVELLEMMIKEETRMRYEAWSKLANSKKLED
jgi:hypothetical protein